MLKFLNYFLLKEDFNIQLNVTCMVFYIKENVSVKLKELEINVKKQKLQDM